MVSFQLACVLTFLSYTTFITVINAAAATGIEAANVDEACVTLIQYGSKLCHGSPVEERSFTVLTVPGSPCKHTDRMKDNSVKDQYCILDKELLFKQTVFVKDKHCHVNVWEKAISPMHLTYKRDECTYGYKLKSCSPGPCSENEEMEYEFNQLRADATAALS